MLIRQLAAAGFTGRCGPSTGPQCPSCRGYSSPFTAASAKTTFGSGADMLSGAAEATATVVQVLPDELISKSPVVNRAGIPMAVGGTWKYYCSRTLGREAIPGSDGQCGPNNGPRCPDCKGHELRARAGSIVRLHAVSEEEAKAAQTDFGGWATSMTPMLGK